MHTNDNLPKGIWDSWKSEMELIMGKENIQKSWGGIKDNYDEKFKEFFEGIITQSITNKK